MDDHVEWKTWGFEEQKKFFQKTWQNGSLAHSYLFTGQEMIGKKTLALELAGLFSGFKGEPANNPQLLWLKGETGVGIEEIRNLKKFLSLTSAPGFYRVALIDNSQYLGREASNALLKILEEPSVGALLILISPRRYSLLPTVASRCLEVKFSPHSRSGLISYLITQGLNQAQAEFLADFSNGRLGWALHLKEQGTLGEIKKHLEDFNKLLESKVHERLNFAEKIFSADSQIIAPAELLLYWMFYLRSDFSRKLTISRSKTLRKIMEAREVLLHPQFNHRLAFENLLLGL